MKKLAAVFVVATFLLNVTAPTLVHAAIHLQGAEVNANTLIQDAYVAVIYCDSNDEQQVYKGWIDAIGETAFTLRSRALFGKKTIAYDKVLSVIMSEEATTRVKHEVERLIPEMSKREARTQEIAQAVQRLNQKTVWVTSGDQIDLSVITKGGYAHIVYTSQSIRGTATGRIVYKDSSRITLRDRSEAYNIAYNDMDTLIVAKQMREIERYRETGAQYNVRVRVHAPSIQKEQVVGRLIKMMQDTLVMQVEPTTLPRRIRSQRDIGDTTFYEVPISSISHLEVSVGQYRNTGKGFIIGLGAGLVIFTVSYEYANKVESRNPGNMDGLGILLLGVVAVPSTVIISTLIGANKSDKWIEVSPQRLNLSLAPLPAWPRQAGTSTKGLRAVLTFNF